MLYGDLVDTYEALEKTTKRLEKTSILTKLIQKSSNDDLSKILYLAQGRVFPEWEEKNLGFSSRSMLKAISTATGVSIANIERIWAKKGDLGKVAEELITKKKQATLLSKKLSIDKVFGNIRRLATLEGKGVVAKKISLVTELLTSASPREARFIVGTVLEELRIGIAEGIIRDAIAKAFDEDVKKIEDAFNLVADYSEVAILAKANQLGKITLKPGKPLKLMLALLAESVEECFGALGKPLQMEPKLDGFRLEIHKDGNIKLFTRNMEEVTKQFPEVIDYVRKNVEGDSFILDTEAVGIDRRTGKHLPFQKISQRIKRKYNILDMAKKFPVEVNVFDILYYNGRNLMGKTLKERRDILEKVIRNNKGKMILTKKLVTSDKDGASEFFKQAISDGDEGIMAKSLESVYKPGRYVGGWLKLKQTLEPLDLVVVKAEFGEGKRATWLTSYTMACKEDSRLLEVGKVSTGVKEKSEGLTYKEMTNLLKPLMLKQKGKEVTVKPKIIIEVGYEEIQKSPTYSSGYALRFPRVLMLRDKLLSEISDINTIRKIYSMQKRKSG